jgi:antitoxin (DNA-binding transcriptional repressor) of toxin-antitoxin stability system
MTRRSGSIMDGIITEEELARHLGETLDRVRLRGEQLMIDREGAPIAVLSPIEESRAVTWRSVAARLAEIGFPGDGFGDDVEAAQTSQPRLEPPAWPS